RLLAGHRQAGLRGRHADEDDGRPRHHAGAAAAHADGAADPARAREGHPRLPGEGSGPPSGQRRDAGGAPSGGAAGAAVDGRAGREVVAEPPAERDPGAAGGGGAAVTGGGTRAPAEAGLIRSTAALAETLEEPLELLLGRAAVRAHRVGERAQVLLLRRI